MKTNAVISSFRGLMTGFFTNYHQKTPKIMTNQKRRLSSASNAAEAAAATAAGQKGFQSRRESLTSAATLPKLPVPSLNDTLSKFVKSARPFLTEDEFQKTVDLAKSFASTSGEKLQNLLEARATKTDNWLSEWWLQNAYLEYRLPVVVYSSPGLVFPLEKFSSMEEQLAYASKMIYGALCYKQLIDTNTLPKDKMGSIPLDMSQYKKVFGTNRNPAEGRDELVYHSGTSEHICVAYKNNFFKLNVYQSNGAILTPGQLLEQLRMVIEHPSHTSPSSTGLSGIPVGILTSEHRDNWAKSYKLLQKDPTNKKSMKAIEESLFVVAIDKPNRPLRNGLGNLELSQEGVEDPILSERQTIAGLQMIHGNKTNSGNRWFDKTIQFIVGSEGEVGLTYEHSPSEGPPIANLMDYIVNNMAQYQMLLSNHSVTNSGSAQIPQQLPFNLADKNITKAIASAQENMDKMVDDLDMSCFTFKKYGKDFIKNCKLSPDSYIQMAIQCAFFRVHGEPGAHYESASTRMYTGGRTETIRSCSEESVAFAKTLLDPMMSPQDKFKAMKTAIDSHKNYAADAVKGHGVDRHLLGLKLIANENGIPIADIFKSKAFTASNHFRLSTSQVPSMNQAFMCYGPLVPNGYGCCYNPTNSEINIGVSAFNDNAQLPKSESAHKFKIALQQTLLDMQLVALQCLVAKL